MDMAKSCSDAAGAGLSDVLSASSSGSSLSQTAPTGLMSDMTYLRGVLPLAASLAKWAVSAHVHGRISKEGGNSTPTPPQLYPDMPQDSGDAVWWTAHLDDVSPETVFLVRLLPL